MPRLTFPLACFFLPSFALASSLESQQDHHIVVKGDTLWAISAAAFDDPWKWPDIWAINRRLIRNPNLIYPRQDILLRLPASAAPASGANAREHGAASSKGARTAARNHHIVVKGDTLWDISAAALDDPWKWPDIWAINRGLIRNPNWIYPGQDISLDLLAQAQPAQAQPAQAQPTQAQPTQAQPTQAQPANRPQAFAHVISIYSGTSQNAQRNIVMIDRGRRDGVSNGLVLALYQSGKAKKDASQAPEPLGASYAQVQVYRTFDDVAYALVTQESSAVKLMDVLSVVPAVSSVGAAPSEQAATAPATPR
jgi:hypothetical protein